MDYLEREAAFIREAKQLVLAELARLQAEELALPQQGNENGS